MKKTTLFKISVPVIATVPIVAFAADFQSILGAITAVMNLVMPLLIILATIVDLYGVIMYLAAGEDQDRSARGIVLIYWASILLAAMVAIWGLVLALVSTFQVGGTVIPGNVGGL